MNKVMTIGTFDLLHEGHIKLINQLVQLGDNYVVGVNSDRFVKQYKGVTPILDEEERISLIRTIYPQVEVVLNDDEGYTIINEYKPDMLIVGSDWAFRDYEKQIGWDKVTTKPVILFVPYTMGISSTEIKRRIKSESRNSDSNTPK